MKLYIQILAMIAVGFYLPSSMAQENLEAIPDQDVPVIDEAAKEASIELVDPEVKVRQAGDKTIKEYQERGRTYKVEVIPKNTPAYILSDQNRNGELGNSNNSVGSDVVVPEWKIGSW